MSAEGRSYLRFSKAQRVQHGVLMVSFTVLALTGLPQRYAATAVGERTILLLGGIEAVRFVHRIAAVALMAATIYHFLDVAYFVAVERVRLAMLPVLDDARHAWQTLLYNFGLWRARPRMGRYTFEEKVEYWALIWGTLLMIATGFMLWNPIATARLLPGQLIPASQVIHGGEAVLAVLAIVVWHGYGVHVRHFNRSMFTGTMSEEEMRTEHPLELEELRAGRHAAAEPAEKRRRLRVFVPVAAVVVVALFGGLYYFVTFEETAITTVPRRSATTE